MVHQPRAAAGLHLEVAADPNSVALARDAVRDCDWVSEAMLDHALVIVSELVTNAVRHAGLAPQDTVLLDVTLVDDAVHVEVTDQGPGFDRGAVEAQSPSSEGGYRLRIVAALSRAWGVGPGTGVAWADVAVARPAYGEQFRVRGSKPSPV